MRNGRCRLLAGPLLALIVMPSVLAPTASLAGSDRVELTVPPPPPLSALDSIPPLRPSHIDRHAAPPPPASAAPPTAIGLEMRGPLDPIRATHDPQVGAKLRALIASPQQFDRHVDWLPDRKALARFYAARAYAPIWLRDGKLTARGQAVIARLKDAAAEGLDPADYPVPNFAVLSGAQALAEADLELSNSALDFARHLASGRIAPHRVVAQIEYGHHTPPPGQILKTLTQADDVNAAFDSYDPPAPAFRALKEKLAALRRQRSASPRIAGGPAIRPGTRDARIPALRARLHVSGRPGDTRYGRALYAAIRRLQRAAHLRPDGIIGPETLAAINGPNRRRIIDTITANMERWRWLPHQLGRTYVMVNIPDFSLELVHDNRVLWRTKIVDGKPTTPTPLLSAPMQQVIVNPSWHVPQSIIENELLPRYRSDPNIFYRMGLRVKRSPDGRLTVVQPPGARNALGRIKFVFPNRFEVYLHDTPAKRLFTAERRAFSHGCMRVQDPTKLGELILGLSQDGRTPSARQLQAMFGHHRYDFALDKQPMVYVTYQTAFVDDSGKLRLRDDIYGIDARMHAILHGPERRIADVPPPPDPERALATLRGDQEILSRVERREVLNPFAYFQRVFR